MSVQLPTSADSVALHCCWTLQAAAALLRSTSPSRRAHSSKPAATWARRGGDVDRSRRPPGAAAAANPPQRLAAVDRWDRQTDRRTDTVPLRRPCRAYYASSANNGRRAASTSCLTVCTQTQCATIRCRGRSLTTDDGARHPWSPPGRGRRSRWWPLVDRCNRDRQLHADEHLSPSVRMNSGSIPNRPRLYLSSCVSPSVRSSQAGIVSKRLHKSSWYLAWTLPSTYDTYFRR